MWRLILVSALVAIGRFTVPGHGLSYPGSYEAFAHIWVGALIVLCFVGNKKTRSVAFILLLALTALETVKFLTR